MSLRILLVDDHKVMRDGLRAIIARENVVDVVGEADNGLSAVHLARKLSPDVVVMDIGMQDMNGIEATREIRSSCPDVKVVALSTYSDKRYVLNMLEAGAQGYVLKDSASSELLTAIRVVAEGQSYLSPPITSTVVQSYTTKQDQKECTAYSELGAREREVLQLLAEGRTSREIATLLHISPRTVETHRRNIMRKLAIHSIAELTKYAIREGLTTLDP